MYKLPQNNSDSKSDFVYDTMNVRRGGVAAGHSRNWTRKGGGGGGPSCDELGPW